MIKFEDAAPRKAVKENIIINEEIVGEIWERGSDKGFQCQITKVNGGRIPGSLNGIATTKLGAINNAIQDGLADIESMGKALAYLAKNLPGEL